MTNEITLPWPGWTVTKLLGAGGYGRVYEIHREQYGVRESAAVKILSFPRDSDEVAEILHSGYVEETLAAEYHQQVENVLREYRVLMKLKGNPNIVICDTYDVVPHEDGIGSDVFIRMELLTPLKKYLIGNPATPERAVQLGVAMCDALSCCWKHKILHRDIKPENILVSNDGIFKLSDFGEAKLVEKTMASGVAGTWSFVAPEVGNHNRYSEPADIYSLGMVLYWMLNHSMLPFLPRPWGLCTMAEQDEARNRRLSGEPLPPPAEGSPALQAVVLKACSFRPEDRYARPEEFRAALLAALEPGADEPSANWQRAHAENRPVDNDVPTADEGSMGNNWVSGGSPLHEATMPTDDDDDPTMPDPTKTAQTGSRASSHANAQPVKGNDLYREVTIPASETAIGCTVRVADATGKMLEAKVPQNCQSGKVLRIKGHGYPSPNGGENGDLYITVQVKTEIPAYHAVAGNAKSSAKSEGNKSTPAKKKGFPLWIVLVIIAAVVFYQYNKQSGGEKPNSDVNGDSSNEASYEVSYIAEEGDDPYIELYIPKDGDMGNQQIDEIQTIVREKDCHTLQICGGYMFREVSSQLLERIGELEDIERICIVGVDKVSGLEYLSGLSELTMLLFYRCYSIDFNGITALNGLTRLELLCSDLEQVAMLAQLPNLDYLDLSYCEVSNLEPLANLKNIRSLSLCGNQITDLTPLSGLSQLTELNIARNQIRDLTPLSGMTQLEYLWADDNQINDLTPLSNLTRLAVIQVLNNQITSLDGLENLHELRAIWLSGNPVVDTSALEVSGRTEALHLEWE